MMVQGTSLFPCLPTYIDIAPDWDFFTLRKVGSYIKQIGCFFFFILRNQYVHIANLILNILYKN